MTLLGNKYLTTIRQPTVTPAQHHKTTNLILIPRRTNNRTLVEDISLYISCLMTMTFRLTFPAFVRLIEMTTSME